MAKIYSLKIENFRGIQSFEQVFGTTNLVCILGRGDSGKTTILEAISLVLSPSWNQTFIDSDFFNCEIENPIVIEATLFDLPAALMTEAKYGLHKRGLSASGAVNDVVEDSDIDLLTIRLTVEKDLEPQWMVINGRLNQAPIDIKASDRAQLNVFYVSDYIDRHFSWNRGTPLYSLLKADQPASGTTDAMIEALRDAKAKIDQEPFAHLQTVTERIILSAEKFGLDISGTSTTVDLKDLTIKDGRICLHDGSVPFRLKGKGSKRLISIAVQMELANTGGIILIDEIEQGLEPDRAKHLARTLKAHDTGQVFLTTHSRDVLVELTTDNLFRLQKGNAGLKTYSPELQHVIYDHPEAFFADKVLICEGDTEIGITRGIDRHRIGKDLSPMTSRGVVYADGIGSGIVNTTNGFLNAGYEVALFCDSDVEQINAKKDEWRERGCMIFDMQEKHSIEHQIFNDLPWPGIKELMTFHMERMEPIHVTHSVRAKFSGDFPEQWLESDSLEMRKAIAEAANYKKNGWFKGVEQGEQIAAICIRHLPSMNDKHLKTVVEGLSNWMGNA